MAITLDELLGRNRTEERQNFDAFPPMEEYTARRAEGNMYTAPERPKFDIERRPYTPPRSVEETRRYEASRPYEAPRTEEYRPSDRAREYEARYERYDAVRERPVERDYRRDYAESDVNRGGFYQFAATDTDRAPGQELYDRLSMTSTATAEQERVARQSYSENYAETYRKENVRTRKKVRLGLKAKLIIAAYAVVFAVIAILIGVNARPLNKGTAAVPSSGAVSAAASADYAENSVTSSAIQYGYEVTVK